MSLATGLTYKTRCSLKPSLRVLYVNINEKINLGTSDCIFEHPFPRMAETSGLEVSFEAAAAHVASIAGSNQLQNDSLLQLYGLYKQATSGPCTSFRPSFFDRKARSKW